MPGPDYVYRVCASDAQAATRAGHVPGHQYRHRLFPNSELETGKLHQHVLKRAGAGVFHRILQKPVPRVRSELFAVEHSEVPEEFREDSRVRDALRSPG